MLLLRSPARIASRLTRYTWGLPAVWRPTRIRLAAPSSVGPATRPIASDTRVSRWSGKVAGRWTWPRMVIAMLFEATREPGTWGRRVAAGGPPAGPTRWGRPARLGGGAGAAVEAQPARAARVRARREARTVRCMASLPEEQSGGRARRTGAGGGA